MTPPVLGQVNLVVRDMDAAVGFYRRLGLEIDVVPGGMHAAARTPGGLLLEWDTAAFASAWDPGRRDATGGSTVLGFRLGTRDAVDATFADLTGAGHAAHLPPHDAFWGARYAIVDDPDGNGVGLMSPADPERSSAPPGITRAG